MRVLAISGSLRSQSTNTTLLRALVMVAPPAVEVALYTELDQIPPFNPDLELSSKFESVTRFRSEIRQADAVIFSTPEYAHGIPGSLKNALDWIVGSGELSEKPVALCNASSRAVYAQAALKEVLMAMNTRLLAEAETTIDLPRRDMTAEEIAQTPAIADALRSSLRVLIDLP